MESTQQKNHTCPTSGHCCECGGCGSNCSQKNNRRCSVRHIIVLILAVIAAFYIGMKLGEIKGYIIASNNMMQYDDMSVPQAAPQQ